MKSNHCPLIAFDTQIGNRVIYPQGLKNIINLEASIKGSYDFTYEELFDITIQYRNKNLFPNVANKELEKLMLKEAVSALEEKAKSTHQAIADYVLWRKTGSKIFYLTLELYNLLMNTDLKNIPWDVIKLPFDSFTIKLPSGKKYPMPSLDLSSREPDEFFVYNIAKTPNSTYKYSTELNGIGISPVCSPKNVSSGIVIPPVFHLSTSDTCNVLDSMSVLSPFQLEVSKFVINFVLYLSSLDSLPTLIKTEVQDFSKVKSSKKRAKAEREFKNVTENPYYRVGEEIQLPAGYAACNYESSNSKTIKCTFMVRGHWKIPNRKDGSRTPIWIKPYLKGLIHKRYVNKPYKVGVK